MIASMTLTPTKKCSACQPRQSKIKLTQPGRRSAYKIKSPLLSKKASLRQTRICPGSTISSRPIKQAPILYDLSYPTSVDPPNAFHGFLPTPLNPMLKNVPAHLENSLEHIRCIQAGDLTINKALPYSCSLDVVSLYNTVPIQEAITNAADRIQNPILHLSKHDISDLLQVTLNNMYFSFRDQDFRQRESLPMSSSISGILATLFMDKLEIIALSSHRMISPYKSMLMIFISKYLMKKLQTTSTI